MNHFFLYYDSRSFIAALNMQMSSSGVIIRLIESGVVFYRAGPCQVALKLHWNCTWASELAVIYYWLHALLNHHNQLKSFTNNQVLELHWNCTGIIGELNLIM